ncbi:WXG100 family type VII secretion target [Nocardioides sp.]|uniref:WXG100 family type VII secretion target n=1 Tax=Nocardioides sp. TaxID=35761 RepID=UPI00261739BF|nr:WXG100 family type VII secretion target [Nocardioides sp.]
MTVPITGQVAGALDRAAMLTLAAHADLEAQLGRLGQDVAATSGRWEGAGARAFAAAYDAWATQQRSVLATLVWFHDQLRAIEALNGSTDTALAAGFGVRHD